MRYLYVSQSCNPTLQKRTVHQISLILVVPHILILFHIFNSVQYFLNHGDHPFLLFHACSDPYSNYDIPIYKLLVIDNAMICFYQIITVLGNVYVWKYLRGQTERNKSLKEVDKKKERKRNFVSAKNGIRTAIALIIAYFYNSIFYGFKVNSFDEITLKI